MFLDDNLVYSSGKMVGPAVAFVGGHELTV